MCLEDNNGLQRGALAYCWGNNYDGEAGVGFTDPVSLPTTPVAAGLAFLRISAGAWHSCGITSNSAAYCWGLNNRGQLGAGDSNSTASPVAYSRNESDQRNWRRVQWRPKPGGRIVMGDAEAKPSALFRANLDALSPNQLISCLEASNSKPQAASRGWTSRAIRSADALVTTSRSYAACKFIHNWGELPK